MSLAAVPRARQAPEHGHQRETRAEQSAGDGPVEPVKQARRLDPGRRLETWERYRALNDAIREAYDLIDIANREARFALLSMGALNAMLFVMGTRTELVVSVPDALRPVLAAALFAYGAIAVYFLVHAVEILRPRKFRPHVDGGPGLSATPRGVRYFEDVVKRDMLDHMLAWQDLTIGQLNAELAAQLHSLALKNKAKQAALRRLFRGLRLMTLLVGALVTLLGLLAFLANPARLSIP